VTRHPVDLVIKRDPSFPEVDLASDDVLFNNVTSKTQLCCDGDGMPWRGAKEKSEALIKLFVQGLSPSNGIIADMTASTGLCPSDLLCISYHSTISQLNTILWNFLQVLALKQHVTAIGTFWP
jgi:hypothetical protein